jgi:hypothetical protein
MTANVPEACRQVRADIDDLFVERPNQTSPQTRRADDLAERIRKHISTADNVVKCSQCYGYWQDKRSRHWMTDSAA